MKSGLHSRPVLAAAVMALAACRAPTQWRVLVHNEVACGVKPRVFVWTATEREDLSATPPSSSAQTCDGHVDDVVIVPSSGTSFTVQLSTRVDGADASLCNSAKPPKGCITQRWKLSFRDHEPQSFETTLSLSCVDVECPTGETCVGAGRCVAATLEGSCADGCRANGNDDKLLPLELHAGGDQTCLRTNDGRLACWGAAGAGAIGAGQAEAVTKPRWVDLGAHRVSRVAMGRSHTCVLLDDGSLRCFGGNLKGELGYGDTRIRGLTPETIPGRLPPVPLPVGRRAKDVVAGVLSTCAILDDGSLRCWGGMDAAQLGYGDGLPKGGTPDTTPDLLPPVPLGPGRTAKQVTMGSAHTCVLRDDDTILCFGRNESGQLGLGDTATRGDTPLTTPDQLPPVPLGARVPALLVGGQDSTCAVTPGNQAFCWGRNNYGVLGLGDMTNRGDSKATLPSKLPYLSFGSRHLRSLFMRDEHACAWLDDNSLRCWGTNSGGELGYGDVFSPRGSDPGTSSDKLPPVRLPNGLYLRHMALGQQHTCGIFHDGSLRCWGLNTSGQLGYGDTDPRGNTPETTPDKLPGVQLPP